MACVDNSMDEDVEPASHAVMHIHGLMIHVAEYAGVDAWPHLASTSRYVNIFHEFMTC